LDSDKITTEERERINEADSRTKRLKDEKEKREKQESLKTETDPVKVVNIMRNMQPKDFSALGGSIFANPEVIKNLEGKILEKIIKDGKISQEDIDSVKRTVFSNLTGVKTSVLSALLSPAYTLGDIIDNTERQLLDRELASRARVSSIIIPQTYRNRTNP
jgi:hypothetical protein